MTRRLLPLAIGAAYVALYFVLPHGLFSTIWIGIAVTVSVLAAGIALLQLGGDGVAALWRRSKVKNNPLDPALRPLLASELSWQNCALDPDFSEAVLTHFRFLVEEEGFAPARKEPALRMLSFRRADVEVGVLEHVSDEGPAAGLVLFLFRSPHSTTPIADRLIDHPLGDGFRGAAFYLKSHLDKLEAALREEAAEPPEETRPM